MTHCFTKKREDEKLLREKAEALLFLLHQIHHRLTVWRLAIGRQAGTSLPAQAECPEAFWLDLGQVWGLQELYFPALESQVEAMVDALLSYAGWLEAQWDQQDRDLESWRAQFCPKDGTPLAEAYETACEETIEFFPLDPAPALFAFL
jgi:hypothetical protein